MLKYFYNLYQYQLTVSSPEISMSRKLRNSQSLTYPLRKVSLSQNAQRSHKNLHKTAKRWLYGYKHRDLALLKT